MPNVQYFGIQSIDYDFEVNNVGDSIDVALEKEISSPGKLHSGYRAKSNLLSVQAVHNFM